MSRAGLRTRDLSAPWPEEANRQITGRLTRWHFAPTDTARKNLLEEAVPAERIHVTGNTVIDALQHIQSDVLDAVETETEMSARFRMLDPARKLILVTGHRRENFDGGLDRMCAALAALAQRGDCQVVYPVHLNPVVRAAADRILAGRPKMFTLIEPQPYLPFLWLIARSYLIITDSGGIQGRRSLLRQARAGDPRRDRAARGGRGAAPFALVGTDPDLIVSDARTVCWMIRISIPGWQGAHNPYGDGKAAGRIAGILTGDVA